MRAMLEWLGRKAKSRMRGAQSLPHPTVATHNPHLCRLLDPGSEAGMTMADMAWHEDRT